MSKPPTSGGVRSLPPTYRNPQITGAVRALRKRSAYGRPGIFEESCVHIARTVFRDDHEMFRTTVRRFFERECLPRQAAWDLSLIHI